MDLTNTVIVDVPDPPATKVMPEGTKDAPRPAGTTAVRFTLPANPLTLATLTVKVPEEPTRTFNEAGAIVIANPGPSVTLMEIFTECDSDPLVPVTVRV